MTDRTCSIDGCARGHVARGMCKKHYNADYRHRTGKRYDPQHTRQCEHCLASFTSDNRAAKFCSHDCYVNSWRLSDTERKARRRASRAQRKAIERTGLEHGEPIDPQDIYQRDGWRCGICQQPVGRSYRYPHPRSASLDHIIPLADGGTHTRENVQCSHLRCNLSKKHTGAGQLRLMG